eukprot:CAMPEP_0175254512 /NCGR_PEP_ID=MMETSP0093-20121207/37229_1 /TAXON_ID=311494 /ORGANISM="Alexandrium monilatum, Strain CCMP3105" /LENGTH=323 /DNA_ID=CAMNT_0016548835 /DNA_START=38 /DNA_END=1009 /DNA_ORIENTATION=-
MALSPQRRKDASAGFKAKLEPLVAERNRGLSWRGRVRLMATLGNSAMVLYIYVAHLLELEWERFGRMRVLGAGESQRLWDYLRTWELEPAFEHLRLLTFSEAMLQNLHVYMIVGTPVAVTLFVLERDRVRWLQDLAEARLPPDEAGCASWWLRSYLNAVSLLLALILAIGPFHLGLPRAHYLITAMALSLGVVSICFYLTALHAFEDLLDSEQGGEFAAWTFRVRCWVRPALKLVIILHILAGAAAVLKAESLHDDLSALIFGILETMVVLGYQLYQGVFVVDDIMVGRVVPASRVTPEHRGQEALQEKKAAESLHHDTLMGS